MVGGCDLFYLKFWVKLTASERNRRFSIYFRLYSASAVTPSENVPLGGLRAFTSIHHSALHFAYIAKKFQLFIGLENS